MKRKSLSDSIFNTRAAPQVSSGDRDERSFLRLREASKTLLYGCLIAMIGVALYFSAMGRGDQQADLASALGAGGAVGWSSVAIILIGGAMWFAGCIEFLNEELASPADSNDW